MKELKLLDINGRAKVKHAFEGWFIRDFDVADTNSDGIKEIIISLDQIGNRSKGAIIVYSFKKGIIWERSLPIPIIRLACMRSEKYGYLITAISQNGKIYGINNRGLLIWEYETIPQGCLLTKIPPSCNNNRNTGIIASSSTEAWCLDENGNPLWRYDASSRILAIHVAIHMGLTCSILLGCEGALHLLDCEGNLQFKINLEGKMHLVNSMVTNGDGSLVLIACSKEGQIYLVSQSGNLMLRHDESYKIAGCCQFGFGPNQGLLICGLKSTGWFRNSLEYRAIVLKKYSILSS